MTELRLHLRRIGCWLPASPFLTWPKSAAGRKANWPSGWATAKNTSASSSMARCPSPWMLRKAAGTCVGQLHGFLAQAEANYQKHKARLEATERHACWISWLDELPVKELMSSGAIAKVRNVAKNKPGIVESCLRFFGVASPDEWRSHYGGMQVAFRRSRDEQSDVGAIFGLVTFGRTSSGKARRPQVRQSAVCPRPVRNSRAYL